MTFNGFKKEDFDVFTIGGLEERMDALISTVRPKLEALGQTFSPFLSAETGDEMVPHVAKHARRTKNPPNDTWVAFANNPRGYKMLPHFQIGLWETHVFIWYALIYEAPDKIAIGEKLQSQLTEIYDEIPQDFVWSLDHTKPEVVRHQDISKEELEKMLLRLQNVKKAELLCGVNIPREKAIQLSGPEFISYTENVFKKVIPLYKL